MLPWREKADPVIVHPGAETSFLKLKALFDRSVPVPRNVGAAMVSALSSRFFISSSPPFMMVAAISILRQADSIVSLCPPRSIVPDISLYRPHAVLLT